MKKRVLYIGYNFSPELTGIGKYSGEMMEWLAKSGHYCTIITSFPYYPQWKVQKPYRNRRFWFFKEEKLYSNGGRLTVYRCPMYVPTRPTGLKRMLSDFSFFATGCIQTFIQLFKKKNDFVISVAPSFLAGVLGSFYKTLKSAKHIHHIQDLQIETAEELGMIKSKALLKILYGVESYIFKNSDVISSISHAMINKISLKTERKIDFLPNWTDTNCFYPIKDKDALKIKFGFLPEDKVVLYSGSIGEKQGLENLLFAAKSIENDKEVKFVICGSGPYKDVLKAVADSMELTNISFLPLQPKEDFNEFLNMADVHLIIQKENASDLVMPSKLTTILAVGGVALITANQGTDLFEVVSKYNMGLLVNSEDENALINGILHLINTCEVASIKENASEYAKEYLSIDKIMQHLDKDLLRA